MQHIQDINQRLRTSGLRLTKQRIQLSKILFESKNTFHFTVLDLKKMIEEKLQEKISLATVYNTVHVFQKKGYIKKILLDTNKSYYDTNVKDHHHFFDEGSQTLKDIDQDKIKISTMPLSPTSKKIKSVEVLIRLENDNQKSK